MSEESNLYGLQQMLNLQFFNEALITLFDDQDLPSTVKADADIKKQIKREAEELYKGVH